MWDRLLGYLLASLHGLFTLGFPIKPKVLLAALEWTVTLNQNLFELGGQKPFLCTASSLLGQILSPALVGSFSGPHWLMFVDKEVLV